MKNCTACESVNVGGFTIFQSADCGYDFVNLSCIISRAFFCFIAVIYEVLSPKNE